MWASECSGGMAHRWEARQKRSGWAWSNMRVCDDENVGWTVRTMADSAICGRVCVSALSLLLLCHYIMFGEAWKPADSYNCIFALTPNVAHVPHCLLWHVLCKICFGRDRFLCLLANVLVFFQSRKNRRIIFREKAWVVFHDQLSLVLRMKPFMLVSSPVVAFIDKLNWNKLYWYQKSIFWCHLFKSNNVEFK